MQLRYGIILSIGTVYDPTEVGSRPRLSKKRLKLPSEVCRPVKMHLLMRLILSSAVVGPGW